MKRVNVGIAGFGMSAQVFHTPFLDLDPRFQIKKIYERSTDKAQQRYPYVQTVRDFAGLLTPDIDLVIITTPNLTHFDLAKQAILAGKNVIVEKPLAITAQQAHELTKLAEQNQVMLSVYQNRRWDNGALTVKKLIKENILGDIVNYELRFERYTKSKNAKAWKETGEFGSGLVFDLGVHLIDQVVDLFGKPTALYADMAKQHEDSGSEDYFQIQFYYPNKKVTMSATKYAREAAPHIMLQGKLGSYFKQRVDNQEALLVAGTLPQGDWNKETQENWGILHTEQNGQTIREKLEGELGNYQAYYDNIYAVLAENAPLIVTAKQAADVLDLIEKVYQSAKCGQKIACF
ncbi:Gfo/Idh/MocA family oxidoreductase [Aggregatibacter kilianii]|uniref:Gfo/Idh/MocA family oxidoreductase n=1 Tax=Aggregatibacter kilianii TaxID=2025884 RepID=UPI000D6518A1|nr:Gfo/Idh/MocA family oxidoreductase [Aggregatibacter kilianii]